MQRLKPASVARDFSLLSAVFTQARREWKLIAASPVADLKKPSAHKPRDRRIGAEEEAALLAALGYAENHAPQTKAQEGAYLFLLALETAMRKGEILGLSVDSVYLKERFAVLPFTKNGTVRNVPLSSKACKLLALLIDNAQQEGRKRLFVVSHDYAKHLFASACKGSQITDLHFHDTRHEATTRLARKLDVLDLARMTGHKDTKSLMAYYNATASEMARRLD